MRKSLALTLIFLCGACHSWLLDKDAFARASVNDRSATAKVGTDAEPALSVKPGEKYFLKEGPPGDRQIHFYSKARDVTTVVAATPLHRDLRIQIITQYSGPPPTSTKPGN